MKSRLEKRLEALERHQVEPVKIKLVWYDDPDYDPDNDDPSCIKLKWYDERDES